MKYLALCAIFALAACGADAPPFKPTASAGVTIGPGGVSTSTTLDATNGAVSVGLSL
jgi:hypothetical protein